MATLVITTVGGIIGGPIGAQAVGNRFVLIATDGVAVANLPLSAIGSTVRVMASGCQRHRVVALRQQSPILFRLRGNLPLGSEFGLSVVTTQKGD